MGKMQTLVIVRDNNDDLLPNVHKGRVTLFSPTRSNIKALRGRRFDRVLVELGLTLSPELEGIVRLCMVDSRTPEARIAELEARVRELEGK